MRFSHRAGQIRALPRLEFRLQAAWAIYHRCRVNAELQSKRLLAWEAVSGVGCRKVLTVAERGCPSRAPGFGQHALEMCRTERWMFIFACGRRTACDPPVTRPIAKRDFRNETESYTRRGSPHPSLSPHPMRGASGFSRVRGVFGRRVDWKLLLATTLIREV